MAAKSTEAITIQKLEIKKVPIRIVGDTPLIVHAWSEKAKRMMLEAQMKVTKTKGKDAKDPFDDFAQALYWITEKPDDGNGKINEELFDQAIQDGAKFGFPIGAIKQSANAAAYRLGWVKNQMALRGTYFLSSPYGELGEIQGSVPKLREDMVRVGMGTADLRYRPIFEDWHMDFILDYNASGSITLEQIINCLDAGGRTVGIGEWRPEKDGDFGRFHVEAI